MGRFRDRVQGRIADKVARSPLTQKIVEKEVAKQAAARGVDPAVAQREAAKQFPAAAKEGAAVGAQEENYAGFKAEGAPTVRIALGMGTAADMGPREPAAPADARPLPADATGARGGIGGLIQHFPLFKPKPGFPGEGGGGKPLEPAPPRSNPPGAAAAPSATEELPALFWPAVVAAAAFVAYRFLS